MASAQALADVLEEMKEELGVEEEEEYEEDEEEEDEDEDDDDEDDASVIEAQLRHVWQLMADAASACIEKNLPLHVQV